MKKILFIFLLFPFFSNAQSFNEERSTFANFLKRMYLNAPFDGVKLVDDYDHQYLVSVISLDKAKYTDPSVMNRVAQVKAQSQVSTFLNGANISMDLVIRTKEIQGKPDSTIIETVEQIKQNSVGFSKGLELLSNFDNSEGKKMVFIYFREMEKEGKK
jgi:hypothetical protein